MTSDPRPSAYAQRMEQHRREIAAMVRRGMDRAAERRAALTASAAPIETADDDRIIQLRGHGDARRVAMSLVAATIAHRRRRAS